MGALAARRADRRRHHGLWPLGFNSAGRRLFKDAGVRRQRGVRGRPHHRRRARLAVELLRGARPAAWRGWSSSTTTAEPATATRCSTCAAPATCTPGFEALPGVVPRRPGHRRRGRGAGTQPGRFTTPSVQIDVLPDHRVVVLATHEQLMGGTDGQVYIGVSGYLADPAYAGELARHGRAAGERLAAPTAGDRRHQHRLRRRAGRPRALAPAHARGEPAQGRHHPPVRRPPQHVAWALRRSRRVSGSERPTAPPAPTSPPTTSSTRRWTDLRPRLVIERRRGHGSPARARRRAPGVVLHMLSGPRHRRPARPHRHRQRSRPRRGPVPGGCRRRSVEPPQPRPGDVRCPHFVAVSHAYRRVDRAEVNRPESACAATWDASWAPVTATRCRRHRMTSHRPSGMVPIGASVDGRRRFGVGHSSESGAQSRRSAPRSLRRWPGSGDEALDDVGARGRPILTAQRLCQSAGSVPDVGAVEHLPTLRHRPDGPRPAWSRRGIRPPGFVRPGVTWTLGTRFGCCPAITGPVRQ